MLQMPFAGSQRVKESKTQVVVLPLKATRQTKESCFKLSNLAKVEKSIERLNLCGGERPGVVAGNFALSFSLNFLGIFVHT